MQLTKEYFDKGISNLLEKVTEKIAQSELSIRADMATKADLKAQSQELKQYMHEGFEIQQGWMDERFNELIIKYDVRERVVKLEKDVAQLKLSKA